MSTEKTYYVLDEEILTLDCLDSPSVAADRFRDAWAKYSDQSVRGDFTQVFIQLNGEVERQGRLPQNLSLGPNHDLLGDIPEEVEARIYVLFTVDPASYHMDADQEEYESDHIEPQLYAMETRAGEKRIRTIESLSLREFVNNNIDDNDADRSKLYRIRSEKHDHRLIHGEHLEQILKRIDDRRGGRTGYQPEWIVDQIDQLERALEDHNRRVAPDAPKP
jgi:hypothetical protein